MFSCSRRRYLNSTHNNYSNNININILFKLILIIKLNFIFLLFINFNLKIWKIYFSKEEFSENYGEIKIDFSKE